MIKYLFVFLNLCIIGSLSFATFANNIASDTTSNANSNSTSDTANWKVVFEKDPASRKKVCLMVSKTNKMQDGQSKTPVYLIYNGHIFFAKTKSNIDLSYPDLGLQIDKHPQHKISVLYKKSSAAFTSHTVKMRDEFIQGLDARLTLAFWPSWPKTGSFDSHFDLHEFNNTYTRFLKCKKEGVID